MSLILLKRKGFPLPLDFFKQRSHLSSSFIINLNCMIFSNTSTLNSYTRPYITAKSDLNICYTNYRFNKYFSTSPTSTSDLQRERDGFEKSKWDKGVVVGADNIYINQQQTTLPSSTSKYQHKPQNTLFLSLIEENKIDQLWNEFDLHSDLLTLNMILDFVTSLRRALGKQISFNISQDLHGFNKNTVYKQLMITPENTIKIAKLLKPFLLSTTSSEPIPAFKTSQLSQLFDGMGVMSIFSFKYKRYNMTEVQNEAMVAMLEVLQLATVACKRSLDSQNNSMSATMQTQTHSPSPMHMVDGISNIKSLKPNELRVILYNFKTLSSKDYLVKNLISSLIPLIQTCKYTLSAQQACNIIYGCQFMHSEDEQVRELLKCITPIFGTCDEKFSSQNISNSLLGLQGMSSDVIEVRNFLKVLIPKISSCDDLFNSQSLSNSIYSLRLLNPQTSSEVRALLKQLTPMVARCRENGIMFARQGIVLSLLGLQSLNGNCSEVRELLRELGPIIESSCTNNNNAGTINLKAYEIVDITKALSGIMNSSKHIENGIFLKEISSIYTLFQQHHNDFLDHTSSISSSNNNNNDPNNAYNKNQFKLTPMMCSFMLFKIKDINGNDENVRFFLKTLVSTLRSNCNDEKLNAKSICQIAYMMNGMNSDCVHVRSVVKDLSHLLSAHHPALGSNSSKHKSTSISHSYASEEEVFSAKSIAILLYGLKGMNSEHEVVKGLLSSLIPIINSIAGGFTNQGVAMACYSLQNMTSEVKEVQQLVESLVPLIKGCTTPLTAQGIGNSMYGLQGMNAEVKEVKLLMNALLPLISSSKESSNPQSFGNSLYGLKSSKSEEVEVRNLMKALLPFIDSCNVPLSSQAISNGLYGLQGMSSSHVEVKQILKVIQNKMSGSNELLNPPSIALCIYGMQRMSTNDEEVRSMIRCLLPRFSRSNSWEVPNVTMTMLGLQNFSSTAAEVRNLLRALSPLIFSCTGALSTQQISNILYGLSSFRSDIDEVRLLLRALTSLLSRSKEPIQAASVGMTLYGFRNMTCAEIEVRDILKIITPLIATATSSNGHHMNAQNVGNALYGIRNFNPSRKEVRELLIALASLIENCNEEFSSQVVGMCCFSLQSYGSGGSGSEEEMKVIKALIPLLSTCKEQLNSQAIGNSVYGLQGLNIEREEVKCLIHALVPLLMQPSERLTPQAVSNALYGIINLLCNSPKAKEDEDLKYLANHFYAKFIDFIKEYEYDNQFQQIQQKQQQQHQLASGLSASDDSGNGSGIGIGMASMIELRRIVELMKLPSVRSMSENVFDFTLIDHTYNDQVQSLAKHTTGISSELNQFHTHTHRSLSFNHNNSKKTEEAYMGKLHDLIAESSVIKAEKKQDLCMKRSYYLFGFESDILIFLKKNASTSTSNDSDGGSNAIAGSGIIATDLNEVCPSDRPLLNVELDGSSHNLITKKRFCKWRDEIYSNNNIKVIRVIENEK